MIPLLRGLLTDLPAVQAKYFKEKRVMEINRDRMIEKIKAEEDAINSTGKR